MNLNPLTFEIDKVMASIPAEQRYHWREIADCLIEQGLNRGDFLWWVVRHPKPEGDVK